MILRYPTDSAADPAAAAPAPQAASVPPASDSASAAPAAGGPRLEGKLPPGYKDWGGVMADLLLQQARLADEMEKLRRQMTQEDEFGRFAKQSVPFLDAMDRMIAAGRGFPKTDEVDRWLHGVESAFVKILKLLEKYGLTMVSCDGQTVDLSKHDVVEYRETADYAHDTVMETALKGIVLRGKVLRDPRVIVACNKPGGASAAGDGGAKGQENG